MKEFAGSTGVNVRPHAKTHKSPDVARLQIDHGAAGITCAKLGEAEVMVHNGIADVLIANQVVGEDKLARLAGLCHLADVKVAVDCESNARALSEAVSRAGSRAGVLVEVDVGMKRCGVRTAADALRLASLVASLPGLEFKGLLGYEGHAVMLAPREARREACHTANEVIGGTRRLLEDHGLTCEIVSGGGTGTYDMTGAHEAFTEIEPGSYVFMDTKYSSLDLPFEQALYVVTTVISVPEPGLCVVDAGLKSMTTEFGLPEPSAWLPAGSPAAAPAPLSPGSVRVVRLSEEHACLDNPAGLPVSLGDRLFFKPSHICTTVNLHDFYHVFADGRFCGRWRIEARGATY
ncbi:MAG: DSD1 family PLP-dependent enzyme [Firmicutes bacterium]|nr:DSD1 family PLP-dependent enzyme [Bacillota bacterium]